ncbi:MAG: phage portal protein [Cellvibrionaceae bacterium]|nr:phage portal protein [Cellvibrionaceae bacterium]
MNIEEKRGDLITYPTLYACIDRIASDIGKLPFTLRQWGDDGVSIVVPKAAYDPVLRKPNSYQTAAQFRECWILSKLTRGNSYILKRRDTRGLVIEMFVLNPDRVMPMVSDSGAVYYQLQVDAINSLLPEESAENLIVPASEIIHDRCMTIYHPLIGIPPLAAANWPAIKNMKIMRSATQFFANNAQPGGLLTGPAGMTDADAKKIQEYWNTNFTGDKSGKVAIIGADMKFTSFAVKSVDSQMIEQMRYSDEQICQAFGVPPFKVGIGSIPAGMGVDGLNQLYYADALQKHIEHMESLLDEGLGISTPLGIELNLEPLLRMDEGKRAEVATKLVAGAIETPNEGRARFNRGPLVGGDTVYLQQQDYPLDQVRLNKIEQPAPPDSDSEQWEGKGKAVALPGYSSAVAYRRGSMVAKGALAYHAERDVPCGVAPGDPEATGIWKIAGFYNSRHKTITAVN